MKKGEIWLADLPYSGGQEQEGLRPAVIFANAGFGIVTIIPLTSNFQALRFQYTYQIEKSKMNGLSVDSIALVFQLRAIDLKRLKKKTGELENKHLKKLDELIIKYLNLYVG